MKNRMKPRGLGGVVVFLIVGLGGAAWAQPTSTDDVVVFAQHELSLRRSGRLTTGQIVVNDPGGTARISRTFLGFEDTQVVSDIVKVRPEPEPIGPTLWELYANQVIDSQGTLAFLPGGSGPTAVTLPLLSYPTAAPVVPGGTDITVTKDAPVTLPPGNYGAIRVRGRGALYLEGGTYNIKSLVGGLNARVYFNAPGTINIAEKLRLGARGIIGPPSELVINPRCLVVNVASTRVARLGTATSVDAMINAPNSRFFRLGGFAEYRGQFVGKKINVGRNSVLEAAPPLTSPCL